MLTPDEKRRRHRRERIVAATIVLLLAAVTVVAIMYVRSMDEQLADQYAYVPRPTRITPEVTLLQKYIQFDTSNPPGDVKAAAEWLAGVLRNEGVPAEVIETAPGRSNVYARIRGKQRGDGLLLLHHIDVVPARPAGWTRPPFSGEIKLDQLYGRGALDMKGTGIAFLRAFLDVAKRPEPPDRDLVFLAVADEETGSHFGLRWLLEHRRDVFDGVRYALNEGGITEMMQERVTYYGIEIGTKLTAIMTLAAPTREALQQARIALEPRMSPRREPGRVMPEVERFFRDLAPHRREFQDELADIRQAIADGKIWRLPAGYLEMMQNNVWAEAVVPRVGGGFEMRVLLFHLPDEDPDRLIAELGRIVQPFGVRVSEVVEKIGPVPISTINTPLWRLLVDEASRTFGAPVGTEILNRSMNDSRFLRQEGIVAYGITPFAVDFFQSESIHASDERVRVEYFVAGVDFMRRLIGRWAVTQNVTGA